MINYLLWKTARKLNNQKHAQARFWRNSDILKKYQYDQIQLRNFKVQSKRNEDNDDKNETKNSASILCSK